jgi:hypothetical protein
MSAFTAVAPANQELRELLDFVQIDSEPEYFATNP